ncbi:hypothetical protein [Phormidium tenue]|uniref:Uncharacterized protein n=1 Tax=Phormidium tenue NIES-30 TaxID=549789 RepID=A0A1U7J284_9CYAN|nr:hypothetical protein [Phormidium tenue]MBD2233740.1 hypothetical protein [Phormidium tenue FACHB-1052]OKH46158.1 hypothetical protein NIES30_17835 [Phormidium tenue NIES-30]
MKNQETLEILAYLKKCRQNLLSAFLNEEKEVFIPMFEFEDDILLMELAIEDFFIGWINHHFQFLDCVSSALPEGTDEVQKLFLNSMLAFIQKYIEFKDSTLSKESGDFVYSILEDKRQSLKAILDVNKRSSENYKKLLYLHRKDKALFQRQLKSLMEER